MLRLVAYSAICLSLHYSVDATEKIRGTKDDSSFHCHKRAAGYYADPRFNCEVFHYCHTDGTRVTIPCSDDPPKHRICFLKDIASKACDGTELFLPLPEDLFFKPSKDTTASALNSVTEFKLPEVLPEPPSVSFETEGLPSTTPLSAEDVGGIFEVFNSFLKEIETRHVVKSNSSSRRPRPSTFSRRSRLPSSLEQKDALTDGLVDVSPAIGRRVDEGPALVEVYSDGTDYSPYRRRSKKLFFGSDKKTPGKHPRRKRTAPDPQQPRPYAIVYAKVPDTTLPGSLGGVPKEQQELPFTPVLVPGNVPVVPVTIETRRRKKKSGNRERASQPNGQQQTSEQQNIYFYAPDQVQPQDPRIRTVVEPRQQVRDQGQPQNERPQQPSAVVRQSSPPAPYAPQTPGRLQVPTFPFQPQPYINSPQQPPYFYGSQQDGFQPFSPPFGLQRPPAQERPRERPVVEERPSANQDANQQRPFSGFQHPFFSGFPGFNSPFAQRDPSPFSLVPPSQQPQPGSQIGYDEQGRPAYSVQEAPQTPPGYARPEGPSSGTSGPNGQDPAAVYGRERIRHQNGNPAVAQPPSRLIARPPSPDPPSRIPERPEENQPPRRPPTRPIPDQREPYSPFYQPEYSPEPLIVRPERPSAVPVQNGIPRDQGQPLSGPTTVLVEDYRQRNNRPRAQSVENNRPREVMYVQREPTPERNREPYRQPEREIQPPQSSYYYSPTTPPPSSRIRQPSRTRDETRPPTRTREETRPPTRTREETRPPTRTREETRPPTRIREDTRPPTRTREETRPPTRSRDRSRQTIRNEGSRHRSRPVEESDVRNGIEDLPDYGHRSSPSPDGRQVYTRVRPAVTEIRPTEAYYQSPPPPNVVYNVQGTPTSRYRENSRERPSQPQIERPPQYRPDEYIAPQGYYPVDENYVNVISTVDDTESGPRTPPSVTVRRPSNRGSSSRVRDSSNHRRPTEEIAFRPMTETPHAEPYYRTRPSVNDNIEIIEEYRAPENIEANRYRDVEEIPRTTVQTSTTRRPTTKRRPPPPRPTFPTFPTFPPPPRRPSTTPRPKPETPEDDIPTSLTKETEYFSTPRNRNAEVDLTDNESLRSKDLVTEDYVHSSTPEVTTRRKIRKRKQRPRRPRPTVSYNGEEHTSGDIATQPTTDREVVSAQTTSGRSTGWRQQTSSHSRRTTTTTTTPVPEVATTASSAKSEEFGSRINLFGRQRARRPTALKPRTSSTTTTTAPLQRDESIRVAKSPAIPRGRKQFTNRIRSRGTTTTTSTANPETEVPVARSDENVEFYNFQPVDTTTDQTSMPEYKTELTTAWPMESTTEYYISTTESYNQMVETTTPDFDEETEMPPNSNEKVGDFESTRSVVKKFQNRPRVLKFGKPKLKATISPIDLNVAESRYESRYI